jgi:hypothetical protein
MVMGMYKCCWNCDNGYPVCAETEEKSERINASKRICCAFYPVSNHLENPFKKRYCKQFEKDYRVKKGHFIDKKEAEKLNQMTSDELMEYWKRGGDGNG